MQELVWKRLVWKRLVWKRLVWKRFCESKENEPCVGVKHGKVWHLGITWEKRER